MRILTNRMYRRVGFLGTRTLARGAFLLACVILHPPSVSGSSAFVSSEAAIHGQYGLRVALDSTGCRPGDTTLVASRNVTGAEWFEGCARVLVEDVSVASSGRLAVHGGTSITLASGFRVEEGGSVVLGVDRSLFGDAYLEKEFGPGVVGELAVRFYFDLDEAEISASDVFDVFTAISKNGREAFQAALTFNANLDENRLFVRSLTDGGGVETTQGLEVLVDPGPHYVDIVWRRAADATSADGSLRIWLDGIEQVGLDSLQNASLDVKRVRLGVMGLGSASRGHIDFDSFLTRRSGPIGSVQ